MNKEMKTLNGYEVVDASARQRLDILEQNGGSGGDIDLTGYATEEYVDNAIAEYDPSFWLNFSQATENEQPATEEMLEFARYVYTKGIVQQDSNYQACLYVKDLDSNTMFVPTLYYISMRGTVISFTISQSGFNLQTVANKNPVTWDVFGLDYNYETDTGTYKVLTSNQFTFASVDDVQTMINNSIGVIENGSY